jgi:hypothetical protein
MSRQTELPTREAVVAALEQLQDEASTMGRRPSGLALARRLGLAYTTFRRHFPDIPADLRAAATESGTERGSTASDELRTRLSWLRTETRDLHGHLDLAIANIQRLTIDNYQLRENLEAARRIPHTSRTE